MSEAASVLRLIAWGTKLSLQLYGFGAHVVPGAPDVDQVARGVSFFCLTLKQADAALQDRRVASDGARETVEDVVRQSYCLFAELEALVPVQPLNEDSGTSQPPLKGSVQWKWSSALSGSLEYLLAHLEALGLTLSVMLQTFYTATAMQTSRQHDGVSADGGNNQLRMERRQLGSLVIEQQLSLLNAAKLYRSFQHSEPKRSPPLAPAAEPVQQALSSVQLLPYQEVSLANLEEVHCGGNTLVMVQEVSSRYAEHVLELWTQLSESVSSFGRADVATGKHQSEMLSPSSEGPKGMNDSPKVLWNFPTFKSASDRTGSCPRQSDSDISMSPKETRPISSASSVPSIPPLSTLSLGQAASSRSSACTTASYSPTSPRTSLGSLPEITVLVTEGFGDSDDKALKIPWRLCTRDHFWTYVDGSVVDSDTERPPSQVFTDPRAWTDINSSWVCQEAIVEADYNHEEIQREVTRSRRPEFETYFRIYKPLTFSDVEQLVERTIEIYRQRDREKRSTPPKDQPSKQYNSRAFVSSALPRRASGPVTTPAPPAMRPLGRAATIHGPVTSSHAYPSSRAVGGSASVSTAYPKYPPSPTTGPAYPAQPPPPSLAPLPQHHAYAPKGRGELRDSRTGSSATLEPGMRTDADRERPRNTSRRGTATSNGKRRSGGPSSPQLSGRRGVAALLDGLGEWATDLL